MHMLSTHAQYVLQQPQCTNKMEYLFLIMFCLWIISFLFIYKIYKIWKNIEQIELELNYYSNKYSYDYINMDSGKNNRENKT